jgi:hypothetical protein
VKVTEGHGGSGQQYSPGNPSKVDVGGALCQYRFTKKANFRAAANGSRESLKKSDADGRRSLLKMG